MSDKILLVDPRGVYGYEFRISSSKIREPIGLEYIASSLKEDGYNVDILIQTQPFDQFLKKIVSYDPDIIGFSCKTYNINTGLSIARKLKEKNHKIITIFGGEHPSADFSIARKDEVDFVVYKEGENAIKELLSWIFTGKPILEEVKGIVYYDGSQIKINPPAERIKDLDKIPFPLRKKEIIEKCVDHGIAYPPPSEQKGNIMVLSSRGCPFNCSFCSSPHMWDRKITYRTPTNVLDEIESCIEKFGTNYIFFADFTFNVNRKKVYELCKEIKKRRLDLNWACQARANLTDEEFIKNIAEAGCRRISFGVESLDDYSLEKLNKKESLEQIITAFEIANRYGILTRASYIIGFPWQTKKDLEEIKKRIKIIPTDELRMTFYTLFPGTEDWKNYKELLLTDDWSLFDNDHVTVKTKDNMQAEELESYRKDILKSFFQSKEYKERMKQKIKMHPEYQKSYNEYLSLMEKLIK